MTRTLLLLACCALAPLMASRSAANEAFDTVFLNGRVIDPESGLDDVRSVGIRDGVIRAISSEALNGLEVIDIRGRTLAPGFIDLHIHGQEPRSYDFLAADGVTTALELEAGVTHLERFVADRRGRARIHFGASAGHMPARARVLDGVEISHFLTARQMENGPRLWWLGLRSMLFGQPSFGHAIADEAAVARMLEALSTELDAGALGIGMGLAYTPGATRAEIRSVLALAAARAVPVFVHLTARKTPEDLTPITSLLTDARATGAAVHIVHVNSSGGPVVGAYLDAIEAAVREGFDVSAEAYPYTASSTLIESAVYDEGWREASGSDYADLVWAATGERLDAESFARYRKEGGIVIHHSMRAEDVARAIAHPRVLIAADGMPMQGKSPHPRGAGTHARVLGHYVRDLEVLDLPTAIRKLTLDPARRLESFAPGMRRKGRIQVGADADLVVFDADVIADRASFENPLQTSTGIDHVVVAGRFVVRSGQLVPGAAPGSAILAAGGPDAPPN